MGIDFEQVFRRAPTAYVLFDRQYRYVAANDAYLSVTSTTLADLIGRNVFDVFPHDPQDPSNANARQLRESFDHVFATGEVHVIAAIVYRVPVEGPEGAQLSERKWSVTNTPVLGADGRVELILHQTEEVTQLHKVELHEQAPASAASVLRRAENVQAQNRVLFDERKILRQLLEQAPVFAVFLRGPQHVVELVNGAYMQLIGHRNVVGLAIRAALPELEGQGFYELLDRVYSTTTPFVGRGLPINLQRTPGAALEARFVDFTYQPIIEMDGSVSGIFAIGTDTTEQYRAAQARSQLAIIVEQSSDFIAAVDMQGKMLFVNEAGRALMGLGDRALADIDPFEFFFPADRAFVESSIATSIQDRGRWHGEFRMRHLTTHEPIPVDYNVFLMADAQGKPAGVASVTRDLRETKAAEQERLFLADAIPVQVWTASPEGTLTYVNGRVTSYFGTRSEAVLSSCWLDYLHPDDVQPCIERWQQSLRTGEPYSMEFRLRAASGEHRWHLARGLALRDERGNVTKWYGTNSDIDDQRRGVEERERLISALAASNRELDRFAYVASHDLKTPLRGIGNLAQWIEDDAGAVLGPESKNHLELLRGRVERMDALIDGVLRYSRSMKPDHHVQEVDVRDLVDVVVDLLAPPPEAKVTVDGALPVLRTAYVALQQVFLNLIGNAVKHAGRPDVEVRVAAREDGPFYVFSVSDNGPGISPEHHQRIWGLFQTLDGARAGAGIGLSVVKRLVELQGGTVDVGKSDTGGVTFRFSWSKHPPPTTPMTGTPAARAP